MGWLGVGIRRAAATVLLLCVTFIAEGQAAPSVNDFLSFSGVDDVALSPDGKFLAAVQDTKRDGDVRALMVYRLENGKLTLHAGSKFTNTNAFDLTWVNESRLLVTLQKYDPKTGSSFNYSESGLSFRWEPPQVLALDADLKNSVFLLAKDHRFKDTINKAQVLHNLWNDKNHVLMAVSTSTRDGAFDVYKVNVYDGEADLAQRGNTYTNLWMTDWDGKIRIRYDSREFNTNILARTSEDGEWFEIDRFGHREVPEIDPVGFSTNPNILFVAARENGDRFAIYEYDIAKRSLGRLLFSHPKVDVYSPILDRSSHELVGFRYVVDRPQAEYLDEKLKGFDEKLSKAFGAENYARPVSIARDSNNMMIIYVSGPRDPGSYYLFDTATNKAQLIGVRSGELQPGQMGIMKPVTYKARDGLEIHAYFTAPPGNPAKPGLVVLPHGGPESRDYLSWDRLAQFLATRGYAVLQPNFRGSDGYGKKFRDAGFEEWGLKMQDDITDGVRHLISQGMVDPNRVCIVGASYGGYAALAGAAFTPELYKCAVSINGVSDLYGFMVWERKRKYAFGFWKKRIGDPGDSEDKARMESRSPINAVDKITSPVLLFAGEKDGIVPVGQSQEMAAALEKAGKPHTYIEFENEGHSFESNNNLRRMFSEIESFLGRHLGNVSQKGGAAPESTAR